MITKLVNGIRVEITESDLEQIRYEPPPSPATLVNGIKAERERRLRAGFDYDFGGERGVHTIGTTEQDMEGWNEVTTISNALIATGNGANTIGIVTDTGPVSVTATEWQQILLAAGQFRQPIWAASFALQAMSPIPESFADDGYWS